MLLVEIILQLLATQRLHRKMHSTLQIFIVDFSVGAQINNNKLVCGFLVSLLKLASGNGGHLSSHNLVLQIRAINRFQYSNDLNGLIAAKPVKNSLGLSSGGDQTRVSQRGKML